MDWNGNFASFSDSFECIINANEVVIGSFTNKSSKVLINDVNIQIILNSDIVDPISIIIEKHEVLKSMYFFSKELEKKSFLILFILHSSAQRISSLIQQLDPNALFEGPLRRNLQLNKIIISFNSKYSTQILEKSFEKVENFNDKKHIRLEWPFGAVENLDEKHVAVLVADSIRLQDFLDVEKFEQNSFKCKSETNQLFVYPQGQRGGISITSYDVKCLAPREFLNDKIIDFYLKYIFNNFLTDEQRNQTHIFGAHFYESLSNAGRNSSILENWTKYVDIFSKDFLIIPICKHHHWNLIIVCYPQLLNRDEDCDYEGKCCCILKFDSLGNNGSHSFTIIREYLSNEYALKHGSNSEFTSEKCFGMNLKVPQQHNSSDCGIYLLTYVEYFFTHPIMNFEKAKLSKETDLKHWFDYSEVKEKRKKIRKLIRDLAISNQTINADNESVIFPNYDSPMDTTESYSEMSNSFNSTRSTRGRAVKQINYYEEND